MLDRRLLVAALSLSLAGSSLLAQSGAPAASENKESKAAPASIKGIWVGFADTQNGQQRVTFVFDSTADGWSGGSYAPSISPDTAYFTAVKIKGDSISVSLNLQGTGIGIVGARSGNWYNATVWVNGQNGGALRLAKAGSAEAAQLFSSPDFDDRRRR